jgi:predicted nucleotidyltransferase
MKNMEGTFVARSPLGQLLLAHREQVLSIATTHRASNVQVFGSVARGEDTPESDVDFLVEFERGVTLFDFIALRDDLEKELNVKVDVGTSTSLKERIKGRVLADAVRL